jgi:hypothetical protein
MVRPWRIQFSGRALPDRDHHVFAANEIRLAVMHLEMGRPGDDLSHGRVGFDIYATLGYALGPCVQNTFAGGHAIAERQPASQKLVNRGSRERLAPCKRPDRLCRVGLIETNMGKAFLARSL